jgi:RNase P subunit RPR2
MVLIAGENAADTHVTVWQCIGCGRIDGPRPCIGVCQDRKVELVYASAHDHALAGLERTRRRVEALEALVRRLACTTPREGEWQRSYCALQNEARGILAALATDVAKDAEYE